MTGLVALCVTMIVLALAKKTTVEWLRSVRTTDVLIRSLSIGADGVPSVEIGMVSAVVAQ